MHVCAGNLNILSTHINKKKSPFSAFSNNNFYVVYTDFSKSQKLKGRQLNMILFSFNLQTHWYVCGIISNVWPTLADCHIQRLISMKVVCKHSNINKAWLLQVAFIWISNRLQYIWILIFKLGSKCLLQFNGI